MKFSKFSLNFFEDNLLTPSYKSSSACLLTVAASPGSVRSSSSTDRGNAAVFIGSISPIDYFLPLLLQAFTQFSAWAQVQC
jgi:hypothetical protein